MSDSLDPDPMPGGDESDPAFDAALRAAFGPSSTALHRDCCGVLEVLRQSSGVTSRILLRDEPDAPSPVVDPRPLEEAILAGGPGRYHLHGEIARGGMGIVLKGRDPDLGRDIAMKVLHPGHAGNPAMIQRFIEEAQIGGQLQHPGILPVYELGLDAGRHPYFTMRLVKGRTLAALLEERPDPAHDLGRFLAAFEQVCQTVAYAHARGVIHRDLKPSNVMVGAFGEVQVVDWGLSKVLRQGAAADRRPDQPGGVDEPLVATVRTTSGGLPSQSGSIIGTPSYTSPEQARGEVEGLDEQADVFALGSILCEILTGQPAYLGSRSEILREAAEGCLDGAFARLDSCGAENELIQLARRCLDPSRAVRPRNAGVLAREVAGFLASLGERARAAEVAAAEARATAAAERRAGRRIGALGLALGLAIATGVGLALVAEHERRARAERAVADIAALSWKAEWFRDQASQIPPDQLGRWAHALAHVRRTAEIVGAGAPDERTRHDVRKLVADLNREEERVRERAAEYHPGQQQRPAASPPAPAGEPTRGSGP
jgi:serine/threonine-protein kinase